MKYTNSTVVVVLALVIMFLMGVVAGIIYSNIHSMDADVGDTPMVVSDVAINTMGYPHPVEGTIDEDLRNWSDVEYVLIGEYIDQGIVISSTTNLSFVLKISVDGVGVSVDSVHIFVWNGSAWTAIMWSLIASGHIEGIVFNDIMDINESETQTLYVIFMFDDPGSKHLTVWTEEP